MRRWGAAVRKDFGICQPAVSQHLHVLRDYGVATVRAGSTRRLYAVDALGTELARGRRKRRSITPHQHETGRP